MKKCEGCGKTYEYIRKRENGKSITNGTTTHYCSSCIVNRRRYRLRKRIVEYLGGSCVRCGYNGCFGAMHAHHVDPSTKEFALSGSHSRSWKRIQVELDKCVLLCSNCHAEEHHDCISFDCPPVSPLSYKQ